MSGAFVSALDLVAFHGLIAFVGPALRVLLVKPTYRFDPLQTAIDGGADAPAHHELDLVGYARRDLTGVQFVKVDPAHGPHLVADALDFGDIAVGDRIWGAVVFDLQGAPLFAHEFSRDESGRSPATTGGVVTVEWSSGGFVTLRPIGPSPAALGHARLTSELRRSLDARARGQSPN